MAGASLWIYRALVAGLLPVAVPALTIGDRLSGKSRPRFRDRLARNLPAMSQDGLWLHAVSVGEVEIARRLVAELTALGGDVPMVLTATTATGLELARRTLPEDVPVVPCPLDLPGAVRRFVDAARPRALVVVETELWPEMLHQAAVRGIPAAVVNARLSDRSFRRYLKVGRWLRPLLQPLALVLARSAADAERFAALGVEASAIRVAGNVKYDLEPNRDPLPWADAVHRAAGDRPVVVAGSTMEGEEEIVLEAAARSAAGGRPFFLVLAPRHPERFDAAAELVTRRSPGMVRRSTGEVPGSGTAVFLLDTIGELARAYRLATATFIGGSFVPTGGHNPLEPAVWGVPVLSGPHVHNFREVYDEMTAAGAAVVVEGIDELTDALAGWLDNPRAAGVAGAAGRAVVEANRGATARTAAALLELAERRGAP
ncbi:MAG: 3-deoxy-D-manno-octulosonic acid transferase [Thermoanaerobaculales bacterium]|jgi:3-deoxy-D-manno-octulosonic-acid transferase|nr:3-deoxy-D-manno-octulosonic acid transferase [Thermoanaerobaculales bacterium]